MTILLIGTADTKGEPLSFLADALSGEGMTVNIFDISGSADETHFDYPVHRLSSKPQNASKSEVLSFITGSIRSVGPQILHRTSPSAIVAVGGSTGIVLTAEILRQVPYSMPKFLITTLAEVAAEIATETGATIVVSPVDIEGQNAILSHILSVVAAQVRVATKNPRSSSIVGTGITQLGVTSNCVRSVRQQLRALGLPSVAFHAVENGTGVVPDLLESAQLRSFLDLSMGDVGKALLLNQPTCAHKRLQSLVAASIPLMIVPGSINASVFRTRDDVPIVMRRRHRFAFLESGLAVMRLNEVDSETVGARLAEALNRSQRRIPVLIPLRGFSSTDTATGDQAVDWSGEPAGPWYDASANTAFVNALKSEANSDTVIVEMYDLEYDDPHFATVIVETATRHSD